MFVGACPASTGGGVKTTTIFVMIMLFASVFRGRDEVVVGKETINTRTIKRAAVVTTAYALRTLSPQSIGPSVPGLFHSIPSINAAPTTSKIAVIESETRV